MISSSRLPGQGITADLSIRPLPRWLYALRWLPSRMPGRMRLVNMVLKCARISGPVEIEADGLKWQVPSLQEPVAVGLAATGMYEPLTCAAIQQALPANGVFFDVGANVGAISLRAARDWCPEGRVVSFEASPAVHFHLSHNAQANGISNATVIHCAVTAGSGETLSFFEAPTSKFGMGSLANRFGSPESRVPTLSLDDARRELGIKHVDVIKVDVEGFELGVFQGALQLLAQPCAPVIVFEFNDWAEAQPSIHQRAGDAQRFLVAHGYRLQSLTSYLAGGVGDTRIIETGSLDLVATRLPDTQSSTGL